ncbi:hypothetical protein ACF1DY_30060 [Streptomyces albus]
MVIASVLMPFAGSRLHVTFPVVQDEQIPPPFCDMHFSLIEKFKCGVMRQSSDLQRGVGGFDHHKSDGGEENINSALVLTGVETPEQKTRMADRVLPYLKSSVPVDTHFLFLLSPLAMGGASFLYATSVN